MGNVILMFGLLIGFLSIAIIPCAAGGNIQIRKLPIWLPIVAIAVIALAFALVPVDSAAAVQMFHNQP